MQVTLPRHPRKGRPSLRIRLIVAKSPCCATEGVRHVHLSLGFFVLLRGLAVQIQKSPCDHPAPPDGMHSICAPRDACNCHLEKDEAPSSETAAHPDTSAADKACLSKRHEAFRRSGLRGPQQSESSKDLFSVSCGSKCGRSMSALMIDHQSESSSTCATGGNVGAALRNRINQRQETTPGADTRTATKSCQELPFTDYKL